MVENLRYSGKLTPDAVYHLYLRAYEDTEIAEEARAETELSESRNYDR